jgi:hypothetical protein
MYDDMTTIGPIYSSLKKSSPNIDGVCIVGGKSHSSPWLVQRDMIYSNVVSIPVENTTYI